MDCDTDDCDSRRSDVTDVAVLTHKGMDEPEAARVYVEATRARWEAAEAAIAALTPSLPAPLLPVLATLSQEVESARAREGALARVVAVQEEDNRALVAALAGAGGGGRVGDLNLGL